MKKIFFFTLLPSYVFACNIEFFSTFLKTSNPYKTNIIKNTNCDNDKLSFVLSAVNEYEGQISASYLKTSHDLNDISISPENFQAISLLNYVQSELPLGQKIANAQIQGNEQCVDIKITDLKSDCPKCDKVGLVNLKLTCLEKTIWVNLKLFREQKVLVTKNSILSNQSLQASQFEEKIINVFEEQNFYNDLSQINFFKTNRFIKAQTPLVVDWLNKDLLVKNNSRVKVILNKNGLSIQTFAQAKGQGSLNESIELLNVNSKKKFIGQIIDYNTVQVTL